MRICLLLEGCYPYVVGGVSSWTQQLIKSFPQHEFIIYAISADHSFNGKYAYELPQNVVEVKEVFLSDVFETQASDEPLEVFDWEIAEIKKLMLGNPDKWEYIFNFFNKKKRIVADFLMSKYFYEIALEVYERDYQRTVFADFLWTMRSVYITLFYILNNPPPKADLYHAISTGYAGIAASIGKYYYGSPFVLTEHGIYTREREEEIIKANWVKGDFKNLWISYFLNMSKCAYTYADRIIALFNTNSEIQKELGASKDKTMVIANGININTFSNLEQKDPNDEYLNVGAVVRVTPIKDIKTMLFAFDIVKKAMPETKFYIMGPTDEAPEYYKECLDTLEELGTSDVIFTGRVNVKEYLGKMDIMVLTSISEAQPLSIMEAMAAKKPSVATNVGCCRELLYGDNKDSFGNAGIVAPIMNYEKIAEAIITILNDQKLNKNMGEAAFKRINAYYTEELFKEEYLNLYRLYEPR